MITRQMTTKASNVNSGTKAVLQRKNMLIRHKPEEEKH